MVSFFIEVFFKLLNFHDWHAAFDSFGFIETAFNA